MEEIKKFIEENIDGEFKKHGGGLEIEEFENGVLKLKMKGACINCPTAILEIENFVFTEVKQSFPEVKKIVLLSNISDELIALGKKMLEHNR